MNAIDQLPETVKLRLERLKALVDRGVGGEAVNAQTILERQLKSLGLSMDDVFSQGEEAHMHWYKYKTKMEKRLLVQTLAKILGASGEYYTNRRMSLGAHVTDAINAEIRLHFDVYVKAYRDETEVLFTAFVHKNRIFFAECDDETPRDYTPEELERHRKAAVMMMGMDRANVRRRVTGE
ncbi:MAG: hypothetical protein COA69_04440 [Robiginitomaculum sp.]|nr:MAG: hypothetical protein COA69_04440 [Robiginitomaculum sp.]